MISIALTPKLVANIKLVAAKKEGTNSTVGSGYERVVNGSNHDLVKCFFIRLSFECNLSTLVGLCFRNDFPIRS